MEKKISSAKKRRILKKGKFLNFIDQDGWEFVERSNCSGIVIILGMTKEGKVIFVEQYRAPVDSRVIEFPAGLINDKKEIQHETVVKAAHREFIEETGYKAGRIAPLVKCPASSGTTSEMITIVRATDLKKVCEGGGDETEQITVHEIPLSKTERWLRQMEKKGCLIGPRIYAGLYFLNKYNKQRLSRKKERK